MDTPKFRLRTLGTLALESNGVGISGLASQRKRLTLLAFLAAAVPDAVPREKILALFWPESDETRARNTLYQFVHGLRRTLGEALVGDNGDLALDPSIVASDVVEFRQKVRAGAWAEAVALYGGPFLDGVFLRDAPELERWIATTRATLGDQFAAALEALAALATQEGDDSGFVMWWSRRAALDPVDSRVARKYIEALAAQGDREGAIRYARIHAELLRTELGVEPDPSLMAFAEAVRAPSVTAPASAPANVFTKAPANGADAPPVQAPKPIARSRWSARAIVPLSVGVIAVLLVGAIVAQRGSSSAAGIAPASRVASAMRDVVAHGLPAAASPSAADAREPARDLGRVLVTPLGNESRDTSAAAFGRLAADWMASGLAQTGVVDVVDAQTVAGLAQLRVAQNDTNGFASDVRPLAAAANARTVVVGRYYTTGDSLIVQVMIENAADGQVLRTLPRVSVRAGDYSKALALLRDRISGAFAALVDPRVESLVDRSSVAPSLPAYRAYAEGLDCYIRYPGGVTGGATCNAAESFEAAIRADSLWNLPYIWLMYANGNVGNTAVVDSLLGVVAKRADRLSDLDRQGFEFFKRRRKGDLEGAFLAARRASALAPRSNWTYQAAQTASQLSRWQESLSLLRSLDPDHGWVRDWASYWSVLGNDEHMLGDYRAQLKDAGRAEARHPGTLGEIYIRLGALIALGDSARVLGVIDSIIANPPVGPLLRTRPGPLLNTLQNEAGAHGHPQLGREISDRCLAVVNPPSVATREQRVQMHIRADCFYSEARWAEAKAALDRLIADLPPGQDDGSVRGAHQSLVSVETHLGDTAAAALHMSRFLAGSDPASRIADSLMMLAHIAAIKGMKDRAVQLLHQMPMAANRYPTVLHLNPDFRGLLNYPPFRALLAPKG
jgi:DNA-binding SARP family transcriptional activator/TolB-like protein